jgi:hypothetical protein
MCGALGVLWGWASGQGLCRAGGRPRNVTSHLAYATCWCVNAAPRAPLDHVACGAPSRRGGAAGRQEGQWGER